MLISDDLPTFDLPMTANSGCFEGGHCDTAVLLFTNSAVLTLLCEGAGSTKTCCECESSSASSHSSCSSTAATEAGGPEMEAAGTMRCLLEVCATTGTLPRLQVLAFRR